MAGWPIRCRKAADGAHHGVPSSSHIHPRRYGRPSLEVSRYQTTSAGGGRVRGAVRGAVCAASCVCPFLFHINNEGCAPDFIL